jgi:hypothetical protein
LADYCTKAQVKAPGRLNITAATYDTEIDAMIAAASRWIDRVTYDVEDAFAATVAASRYYELDAIRDGVLAVDKPLLSVTTLTNGDGNVLAAGTYRLQPRNTTPYWEIRLLSSYAWSWITDGEVEVEGVWGFSATVPAPVQEACMMLAGWMYKRYQAALADATANADLGQLIYGEAMPKQVIALLKPYMQGPKM